MGGLITFFLTGEPVDAHVEPCQGHEFMCPCSECNFDVQESVQAHAELEAGPRIKSFPDKRCNCNLWYCPICGGRG